MTLFIQKLNFKYITDSWLKKVRDITFLLYYTTTNKIIYNGGQNKGIESSLIS